MIDLTLRILSVYALVLVKVYCFDIFSHEFGVGSTFVVALPVAEYTRINRLKCIFDTVLWCHKNRSKSRRKIQHKYSLPNLAHFVSLGRETSDMSPFDGLNSWDFQPSLNRWSSLDPLNPCLK